MSWLRRKQVSSEIQRRNHCVHLEQSRGVHRSRSMSQANNFINQPIHVKVHKPYQRMISLCFDYIILHVDNMASSVDYCKRCFNDFNFSGSRCPECGCDDQGKSICGTGEPITPTSGLQDRSNVGSSVNLDLNYVVGDVSSASKPAPTTPYTITININRSVICLQRWTCNVVTFISSLKRYYWVRYIIWFISFKTKLRQCKENETNILRPI